MPKHLFAETILTQPTCVMDLIQSFSLWGEKNISNQTISFVNNLTSGIDEHIEEYVIDNYTITVKTVIYPRNPSIVILESSDDSYGSKINMILDDNDQTYLTLPKAVKIIAGRNVFRYQHDSDPEIIISEYNPFVSISETYETSNELHYIVDLLEIPKQDFADEPTRNLILEFNFTQWSSLCLEDTDDISWNIRFPNSDPSTHIYSNIFKSYTKDLTVFDLQHFY